ncbi:MAG: ArsR/SmtB family transcription factor [Candidatus Hodarchaeales archaeon]|jgi:ArsR family transcriptional regulator
MAEPCKTLEIHHEKVEIARKKIIESDSKQLAAFFKLLSGETRISILLALSETELCVCDLSDALNMSVSAVSHQLSKLRQGRLVKSRRDGKEVYYSLEIEHLQPILLQTLEHLQEEAIW